MPAEPTAPPDGHHFPSGESHGRRPPSDQGLAHSPDLVVEPAVFDVVEVLPVDGHDHSLCLPGHGKMMRGTRGGPGDLTQQHRQPGQHVGSDAP